MKRSVTAVVLAAGEGKRMRSARTKMLHEVMGLPMAAHSVAAALDSGAERVVVVIGQQADAVRTALTEALPGAALEFALQPEPRGTGDAVRCALPATEGADDVLILYGDTPALEASTLRALIAAHRGAGAALTLTSFEAGQPTGYGRVIRGPDEHPVRVVEERDASPAERRIREVNAGMYLVAREELGGAISRLADDNAQGELYLTDVVELLAGDGAVVRAFLLDDPASVSGINDRIQLARLEGIIRERRNRELMASGVTLHDPAGTRVEARVTVGRDTVLGAGVQLLGATRIGEGCRIDAGCVLRDCVVGDGVHLKPYVVAEGARIARSAVAGPFTHLRPGADLGERSKVGNFVEAKKARIGEGSKASHLTYLGDCEIGRDVNVGAGTITCNYDGFAKHKTVLEDGVFVGSDTQLVAPVRVGRNATIGAGTTVTRDVPEGALVTSRAPQKNREGYYALYREPREEAKRKKKAAAAATPTEEKR